MNTIEKEIKCLTPLKKPLKTLAHLQEVTSDQLDFTPEIDKLKPGVLQQLPTAGLPETTTAADTG